MFVVTKLSLTAKCFCRIRTHICIYYVQTTYGPLMSGLKSSTPTNKTFLARGGAAAIPAVYAIHNTAAERRRIMQ